MSAWLGSNHNTASTIGVRLVRFWEYVEINFIWILGNAEVSWNCWGFLQKIVGVFFHVSLFQYLHYAVSHCCLRWKIRVSRSKISPLNTTSFLYFFVLLPIFVFYIYIYQPACILRWTLDSICLAISFKLELTSNSFSWGCSMSTQNLWYSQKASGIKSVFPQSVECTSLTLGIWI